jgi:predicted enzyme related to lactoylglutathione lyase
MTFHACGTGIVSLVRVDEEAALGEKPLIEWIEVTIDCGNVAAVAEFWRRLLGLVRLEDPLPGWMRAASAVPGGPALTFQPVPEPKVGKTRVHLDLRTDDLPAALVEIRALGGECTGEVHIYDEGTVAVMTDPEGTEFCLLGPPGSVVE